MNDIDTKTATLASLDLNLQIMKSKASAKKRPYSKPTAHHIDTTNTGSGKAPGTGEGTAHYAGSGSVKFAS